MTGPEFQRPQDTERIPEDFNGKVERLQERGNYLCVGLDNSPSMIPSEYKVLGDKEGTFQFNRDIIDPTCGLVCAYKLNVAFYEESLAGERALERTVEYIHQNYPGIPVIGDNKPGDIGATSAAYARKLFGRYKFDAITVSPYLGAEASKPLLAKKDKGIIVVAKTSNPGGGEFQDLPIAIDDFTTDADERMELIRIAGGTKIPLYLAVANRVSRHWSRENGNCAIVVAATYPEQAEQIRAVAPNAQFLVPGVGTQGADLQKAVAASMSASGGRIIINSSSGISFAKRQEIGPNQTETVGQAARREALKLRDGINYYRENPEGFTNSQQELARALFENGVIKFGPPDFTLNLHKTHPEAPKSPFYVDQRPLRSASNEVKLLVGKVLTELIRDLKYDVYADTPTAITWLVSLMSYVNSVPMITPRGEKTHGSGAKIDGEYEPGKTVALLFDDVITSGASANDAINDLRAAGVTVKDFVALVNREQGGTQAIKNNNCTPHWVFDMSNLLRYYKRTGLIDERTYNRCMAYARNNR